MAGSSIASTELVLLSRGLCLEILVMFMGMGGWVLMVGALQSERAVMHSRDASLFLGVKMVTGGLLRRPDRILKSNM